MDEIIHVRGEGGAIFPMEPSRIPKEIAQRIAKGYLKRVNADGSPYVEPVTEQDGSDLTNGVPARPAQNATKADWVSYAVNALGMEPDDAESATKQDLIDLAGTQD